MNRIKRQRVSRPRKQHGPAACGRVLAATLACAGALRAAATDLVVNIDACLFGYYTSWNPPSVGLWIYPFSLTGDGKLNTLTLPAGTYTITNGYGMPGAGPFFNAYRPNLTQWTWGFVIADMKTSRIVYFTEVVPLRSSLEEVAEDPAVQNFSTTLTLTEETTLAFMFRDTYMYDNGNGIALRITGGCAADIDGSPGVDLGDFFTFFNCWDAQEPCADLDGVAGVDLGDFFAFFSSFDAGC